jgi:hypothetical protein
MKANNIKRLHLAVAIVSSFAAASACATDKPTFVATQNPPITAEDICVAGKDIPSTVNIIGPPPGFGAKSESNSFRYTLCPLKPNLESTVPPRDNLKTLVVSWSSYATPLNGDDGLYAAIGQLAESGYIPSAGKVIFLRSGPQDRQDNCELRYFDVVPAKTIIDQSSEENASKEDATSQAEFFQVHAVNTLNPNHFDCKPLAKLIAKQRAQKIAAAAAKAEAFAKLESRFGLKNVGEAPKSHPFSMISSIYPQHVAVPIGWGQLVPENNDHRPVLRPIAPPVTTAFTPEISLRVRLQSH